MDNGIDLVLAPSSFTLDAALSEAKGFVTQPPNPLAKKDKARALVDLDERISASCFHKLEAVDTVELPPAVPWEGGAEEPSSLGVLGDPYRPFR